MFSALCRQQVVPDRCGEERQNNLKIGTPIQNGLEDLFSFLRFIRVTHFENYKWYSENILGPMKKSRTEQKTAFLRLQVSFLQLSDLVAISLSFNRLSCEEQKT
jgi:hypothetical protein